MDIVCLGEMLVDMFPAELGRRLAEVSAFYPKAGGAPANAAVAAARLGARSAFIGKVGDDAFGRHLADVLAKEGVDVRGMRFDDQARTTMAFIAKPDENTSEFVFYRNPGADTRLRADELDRQLLGGTRALHFGSLSLSDEPIRSATWEALRIARGAGALISFDVNYRPSLWRSPAEALEQIMGMIPHTDLVKVNETELALISDFVAHSGHFGFSISDLETGGAHAESVIQSLKSEIAQAGQALLAKGPKLVVVTLGPHGSFFQTAEGGGHVPGFAVQTVDATGCGDAFIAGLLWQLVSGGDSHFGPLCWRSQPSARLRQILRYANAVGAITAQTVGVIPALPAAAQVEAFLQQHKER